MRRFFTFLIALLVSTAVPADFSIAAPAKGKKAKPHPPKKPAPKVHHAKKGAPKPRPKPAASKPKKVAAPPKKPAPKTTRAPVKPKVKPAERKPLAVHSRETAKKPPEKKRDKGPDKHAERRREALARARSFREKNTRRFAHFDSRRREWSFDSHWWRKLVAYPARSGRAAAFHADYSTDAVPAGFDGGDPVGPPVILATQPLPTCRDGSVLMAILDGLDVEHHWLSGKRVNWRTGITEDDGEEGPASNCGALVAALCSRLKVPMPAPNVQSLSPAAQYDWLAQYGKGKGWVMVGEVEAQLLANQGWVVIAAWKNLAPPGERTVPGRTAVVRPSRMPLEQIAERGPRVIIADIQNSNDTSVGECFPAPAVKNHEVVYFAHRPR
jgi:hypothetical protein